MPKRPVMLATARLLIEVGVDLLGHALDDEQGEIGIDVGEDAADLGLEAFRAAVDLEHGAFDVVGHVVDAAHHGAVFVFHVLSEGNEEEGPRRVECRRGRCTLRCGRRQRFHRCSQ